MRLNRLSQGVPTIQGGGAHILFRHTRRVQDMLVNHGNVPKWSKYMPSNTTTV